MLYYGFKDYEEFKEIFGIIEHGNGVKSRKNKILLALYKDKDALKAHIRFREYESLCNQRYLLSMRMERIEDSNKRNREREYFIYNKLREKENMFSIIEQNAGFLGIKTLTLLKSLLFDILGFPGMCKSRPQYVLSLMGMTFYSDSFKTDDMAGLCEDGTLSYIRYYNVEKDRVFKMKAGKMFNNILACNQITSRLPEQIQRWLSEEFVADWIEYARVNIGETEYQLHVNDNFSDIYSKKRCLGYDTNPDAFKSCMQGDGQWTFYRDAVDASAAYLTNKDDMIVARCVIFNKVYESDSDKIWRLAERQYSCKGDLGLQRQLVSALVRGGYIDGYKKVGASCHDSRAFVDNEGNSLESKEFYIDCNLEVGDTLSYQDSFKWYDLDDNRADNCESGEYQLDVTDSEFAGEEDHEHEEWSHYHECYISEDEACYVGTRGDCFYYNETVDAYILDHRTCRFREERCFKEDCIRINGDYYYAGEDAEDPKSYGICRCSRCDDYFVPGEGYSCYSELTEEDYCCKSCLEEAEDEYRKENGEVYSEFMGTWYESEDDVIHAKYWCRRYENGQWKWHYDDVIIGIDDFNDLVEEGTATEFCGKYYIDTLNTEGEPVHMHSEVLAAA